MSVSVSVHAGVLGIVAWLYQTLDEQKNDRIMTPQNRDKHDL